MRYVWGYTILWTGLVFLNLNGVYGTSYTNVPSEEDEIMQTSGHQDAFQDGQLAGVLGGLLQQRPDSVLREMTDPDRILCLFNKGKKGSKDDGSSGGHQQKQPEQQGNNQQYGVQQQQGEMNQQAYGVPMMHQPQQDLNQVYGVPQQNQNQMYGPPQSQSQAYGPPQPSSEQSNQNQQYGPSPSHQKHKPPPPQKSYSFSISFGDRLRPRKKQRPQKPQQLRRPPHPHPHPPTPSIEMRPVPPPPTYQPQPQQQYQQQPMIFYSPPQQNFNMPPQQQQQQYGNHQQQVLNLPLPPTNIQPLLPQSFQSPPQSLQNNYGPPSIPQQQQQQQQQQQPPAMNYFSPQNTFNPSPQINFQYGDASPSFTPMSPTPQPSHYTNPYNPIDQLNYKPEPQPEYRDNSLNQQQESGRYGFNSNGGDHFNSINGMMEGTRNGKSFVFVYGPPENERAFFGENQPRRVVTRVGSQVPEKNYQIVFIKAPAPPPPPQMEIQLPSPPEHKTMVYVLVKKPSEAGPEIKFRKPPPTKPSPPEVYFIKYKNRGGAGVGNMGGNSQLPSTSDPNADSYSTITSVNDNQVEGMDYGQNFNYVSNDQGTTTDSGGSYGGNYQSRRSINNNHNFVLPSTSSDFAMEMSSRADFSQMAPSSSSSSHYTAPGSLPYVNWVGSNKEE